MSTKKRIISMYMHDNQLDIIDKIIASGCASNRSEFIRRIIDTYLYDYLKLIKTFEVLTIEQIRLIGE